jgi:Amt family ammonium transporter
MVFQLMFAVITPALITGAFAERAKFGPFLIFMVLWATLIYDPMAHWVWGGGFLGAAGLGALDFAGGTVVHINAGVAALVAAVMYGKRIGYGREPMEPHDITMVVIGAALLWFGWFGFNAGSALSTLGAATEEGGFILTASNAFVVTHLAAGAAAVTWTALSWMANGKPSVVGAAAGAVAGLVAITPAAGFVSPMAALAIGLGAGSICYFAVRLRAKMGLDDSLDVVGVHGVGGAWGAIATGIFAGAAWGGVDGLIYGNAAQLADQLIAVGVTILYSGIGTFVILKVLDVTMGLRVKEDAELVGLDVSEHGERAYQLEPGYAGIPVTPEPVGYANGSPSTNPAAAQT